jgi:hypothetical protein
VVAKFILSKPSVKNPQALLTVPKASRPNFQTADNKTFEQLEVGLAVASPRPRFADCSLSTRLRCELRPECESRPPLHGTAPTDQGTKEKKHAFLLQASHHSHRRRVAWHFGKRNRENTQDFVSKIRWAAAPE